MITNQTYSININPVLGNTGQTESNTTFTNLNMNTFSDAEQVQNAYRQNILI